MKKRQEIVQMIFEKDGLTELTDVDVFNTRIMRVRTLIDSNDRVSSEKKLRHYLIQSYYRC